MLDYLITSRTRRLLLCRLWLDGARENIRTLALGCGLSYAAAHRELDAMKDAGLALAEREGPATFYRANLRHPGARILTRLLASAPRAGRRPAS